MKTKAVRLYGKGDLRLDEFELPEIKDDEILAEVISDSVCMSSYKAQSQGPDHKRVPDDVAENPIIIGHEFCGRLLKVGSKWADKFKEGDRFAIQPALNDERGPVGLLSAPGYSYNTIGGAATHIVIPAEVMENDCLLHFEGEAFYHGSLAEPVDCIVGTYHAHYHIPAGTYIHNMGIAEGGNLAILAGVGPMGLGAIDYAIHCDRKPGLVVVTDIDQDRLDRAASIYTVAEAKKNGVELIYLNTREGDAVAKLMELSGGRGYDDVIVMAPVAPVVMQGDAILANDGCLNFFAGPSDQGFSVPFNFYNVHYEAHHVVGTSGGNTDDLKESLDMMAKGLLNPSAMVTHVGGLNAVVETTKNLPKIPGGKKLMYTQKECDLFALADLEEMGKTDDFYKELDKIVKANNGLWSAKAEAYFLSNTKNI